MRILVVDNHDSFTFNLVQLVRDAGGTDVEVVRNDEPLPAGWQERFDGVVISPGPGHPGRATDVGTSAVVAQGTLPVLGVCLGHQLLAVQHGCEVTRAAHPMHGEVSSTTHTDDPLFDGVPETFDVVRYHSLAVEGVREPVQPIAVADDGTLMALRIAGQPRWGVQFHPESIESGFGRTIVANFLRCIEARAAAGGPRRLAQPRQRARRLPVRLTVPQVLRALEQRPQVVLDGIRTAPGATASVLGWGDDTFSHELRYRCGRGVETVAADGTVSSSDESVLDALEHEIGRVQGRLLRTGDECGVTLGYAGYLGYEVGYETLGLDGPATPHGDLDAWFLLVTRGVVVRDDGALFVVGWDDPGDPTSVRALDRWLDVTASVLADARPGSAADADATADPTAEQARAATEAPVDVTFLEEEGAYLAQVAACQEAIADGESYELCLTNRLHGRWQGDPLELFRVLRADGAVPHAAYLDLGGDRSVVSGSPELFLAVTADGRAMSRPIKGTRPASGDPDEDARRAAQLSTSVKDRAENLMIVDLVRHDLTREAVPGSTVVTELYGTYVFPTVIQLVSTIECDLRPSSGTVPLLRSAFPPGSMTGAPKERSVAVLRGVERERRGVYSGSIGLLGLDGSATLNVAIRTVVLDGEAFVLGVGGAVTRLSTPEEEWQETLDKAASSLGALAATRSATDPAVRMSDGARARP